MASPVVLIDPSEPDRHAWRPRLGEQGESFAARQVALSDEERHRLVTEAQQILAAAQPPGEKGSRTILVVGRVQSGKTLSFEMLTALARDNGFGLVIIIAGISKFLERQTRARFIYDLQIDDVTSQAFERWRLVSSSQLLSGDDANLAVGFEAWRVRPTDATDTPRTAVVLTLKHFAHIAAVTKSIPHGFTAPTLIIDDEADQAGLNANTNRADRPPTTTFSALAALRHKLGSHTYVQYTATPQANLLLAAADTLAPDAVRMITPGIAYVGNEEFVRSDPSIICRIPDDDAAVFDPSVVVTEPPASLIAAIDAFVVAAALGRRYGRVEGGGPSPPQLSMLVHPERLVSEQGKAAKWVESRLHLLRSLDDDPLTTVLDEALTEIRRTADRNEFPATCAELADDIRRTLQFTGVLILNRGEDGFSAAAGEDIPWSSNYAWIVIGGQMVDRGLTIPGLAITYIPRSAGQNVDTVQQRARWLGYKRSYLDRCRIWMTDQTSGFFSDYAEHEAEMHMEVERIVTTGTPLKEWRRQFMLDPQWRLTRRSVISRQMQTHTLKSWQTFLSLGAGDPLGSETQAALKALERHVRGLSSFPEAAEHGHTWCDCTLQEAFEVVDLYPVHDLDDADFKALLLGHIARRIDLTSPDADLARIYLMDDLDEASARERGVNEHDDPVEIKALLQGRNRSYAGDREMRRPDTDVMPLTLQLHRVLPTRARRGGPPLWPRAMTTIVLAAYIPPGSDPGWVVEAQ
jgi:hypothetical protein